MLADYAQISRFIVGQPAPVRGHSAPKHQMGALFTFLYADY